MTREPGFKTQVGDIMISICTKVVVAVERKVCVKVLEQEAAVSLDRREEEDSTTPEGQNDAVLVKGE